MIPVLTSILAIHNMTLKMTGNSPFGCTDFAYREGHTILQLTLERFSFLRYL